MSSGHQDQKKRPPPINIPPLPLPPPAPIPVSIQTVRKGQQQQSARNASNLAQHGPQTTGSTPLTSPLEQDPSRFARSLSNTNKNYKSSLTGSSNVLDQTHVSPLRSDHGSEGNGHDSATQSRQSERSQRNAATTQVQLEARDQRTTRGRIEARNERKLFKMTGQIPPTPTTGVADENIVYIRTEDLRTQCRAVSKEKQAAHDEPTKSPKKKIFGNIHVFNPFSRSSNNTPVPAMPSKAAQVLGTSERIPHRVVLRPIKPAVPLVSPKKVPHSDTSKSLPGKLVDPPYHARHHRSGSFRRNRAGRRSPGRDTKLSSKAENKAPFSKVNTLNESVSPPTPPAKDTPPNYRPTVLPPSPLRRAPPSEDLRESYGAHVDNGTALQLPEFALSPSLSQTTIPDHGETSPKKFRAYTAEEYTKLIEGEALEWPYPETDDSSGGSQVASSVVGIGEALQLPRPDGRSNQALDSNRNSPHISFLQPRFYSPSNRSAHSFAEGETPSKNSDVGRLLFSVPSKARLLQLREDSNNGSIEMVFQGDANDIDPHSSTGQLLNPSSIGQLFKKTDQEMLLPRAHDDAGLTTRVMQELRIDEHHGTASEKHDISGHLQPGQSSARLTDMLSGISPLKNKFNGDFQPNCPSAVPSPLQKIPGPLVQPQPFAVSPTPFDQWGQSHMPKNIEDHFFMTNEHLDVVGKTTWDLLEMSKQQQLAALNTRHEHLLALFEKHIEDIKSQINTVDEKVERNADKQSNIHNDIDSMMTLVKQEVAGALVVQNKKATEMETHIKELQKTVQGLQQFIEQKLSDSKSVGDQHSTSGAFPTPNSANSTSNLPAHRSQPSLAGYYGSTTDLGRENQVLIPSTQDSRGIASTQESHSDQRPEYSGGYGYQWGPRSGFSGHHRKEDRPVYSGTNPYLFASGGQFNNSYAGGYPSYSFSPSPPDQQYSYNQGPTK
ncbi:hypothetical protein BKA66DRAFT_534274 [Pyrenochaeta sp. MPI-SDFR-AT-0127]|nr:hypothetical protein BKA66DRAFT_534274 [Pyrenochaeta sp. MPI-SDFR-AT-0127]